MGIKECMEPSGSFTPRDLVEKLKAEKMAAKWRKVDEIRKWVAELPFGSAISVSLRHDSQSLVLYVNVTHEKSLHDSTSIIFYDRTTTWLHKKAVIQTAALCLIREMVNKLY